jgi:acetyl-CoA carboxylase biotin carboxyl carrier protein
MIDLEELKQIIAIFKQSGIEELEIEKSGTRIKLKKSSSSINNVAQPKEQIVTISSPASPSSAPTPKVEEPVQPVTPIEEKKTTKILAPMVGTFYRAPAPDAPPYVKEGDIVEKEQVLCIIEAMKLMNEIKADFKCKIIQILVENGQPVEFNQPLFLVEPLE